MFDLGFHTEQCFEVAGMWFLFFVDGMGGVWWDGDFRMAQRMDEKGN